jgi:hypothetical protein
LARSSDMPLQRPSGAGWKLRGLKLVLEFERIVPPPAMHLPFVAFMQTLQVDGLDLTRDR